jgi:hypothetical protein
MGSACIETAHTLYGQSGNVNWQQDFSPKGNKLHQTSNKQTKQTQPPERPLLVGEI